MGRTGEKYNITFTQIQLNQKYHHPDDDLEQFAFARTLFKPPNAKLLDFNSKYGDDQREIQYQIHTNPIQSIISSS